jgi:tetratricopeptide (TPR) repeat protein
MICLTSLSIASHPSRAETGPEYLRLCLDDRSTPRLLVEACAFAFRDKALSVADRGLVIARRAAGLKILGKHEAAAQDAEIAHRLAPDNPEVLRIYAKVHGDGLGKSEHAIAALNEIIEKQGADPKLLLDRAMGYYRRGEYDRALADLDQAIALDPKNVEAHRMRGQALTSLMRNEESVVAITEALRLQPGDTWLHMERAGPALVSGQFALARDDLDIALGGQFKNSPFWRIRGAAHYALEAFAEAGEDFTHDIKLEPAPTALTVWRFLADYRGGKATLDDATKLAATTAGQWPSAVIAYFAKGGSPEAALKEADAIPELATTRRSQLEFFLGEWEMLTSGPSDRARKHFATVVEGGVNSGYADIQSLGQPATINDNNILEFALSGARLKEMAP